MRDDKESSPDDDNAVHDHEFLANLCGYRQIEIVPLFECPYIEPHNSHRNTILMMYVKESTSRPCRLGWRCSATLRYENEHERIK